MVVVSESARPSDISRASKPPPTVSVALVIAIGVLSNSATRSSPDTDSGAIFSIGARDSPGIEPDHVVLAHGQQGARHVVDLLEAPRACCRAASASESLASLSALTSAIA